MGLEQCPDDGQIVLLGSSQPSKARLLQLPLLYGVEVVETEAGLGRCVLPGRTPCSQLGRVSVQSTSVHRAQLPTPTTPPSSGPPGSSLTLQLLPKHGQEDGEVDGPGGLFHHGLQLLILHTDATWKRGEVGTPRSTMRVRGNPALRHPGRMECRTMAHPAESPSSTIHPPLPQP